ncbi:MAG: cell envelope biogenesis protein OmpA [Syntrophales bacterium]|nr:cell envelope biogenesis protein OmpA [Syntrophales bacterium]
MRSIWVPFIVSFLWGCATSGPVLYPNAHLKSVGEEQARRDIEACKALADEYIKSQEAEKVAKSTAAGAAGGAVIGGAVGAVRGSLGRGIGVGAAAGAATGLVKGSAKATKPSQTYKNFVNRCLKEKGYEPIGWED